MTVSAKMSNTSDISDVYKVVANFYNGKPSEKNYMNPEDKSGQEMQSLIDLVNGWIPDPLSSFNIDWDTFEITLRDCDNKVMSFPQTWLNNNIGKIYNVTPAQYGLNKWPKNMTLVFEVQ